MTRSMTRVIATVVTLATLLLATMTVSSHDRVAYAAGPDFKVRWSASPYQVDAGESVTLTVRMFDVDGSGDHGGISVSFPLLDERNSSSSSSRYVSSKADVEVVSYTGGRSRVSLHDKGSNIYNSRNERMSARYLLVETDDPSWSSSSDRTLELRITPKEGGFFWIYGRGWICANDYRDCSRAIASPKSNDRLDQQGFLVGTAAFEVSASSLPDLTVRNFTVAGSDSPSQFTVGDTVTIRAVVRNTGEGSADRSRLAYYLSGRRIDTDGVTSLDSGEDDSESTSYTFTQSDIGSQFFSAVADYEKDVTETNEDNNTFSTGTFTVVAAAALLPDLEVTGLTVNNSASPSQFTVGEEVTIRAVVRNTGGGSAGSSRLAYYITDGSRSRRIDTDNTRGLDKDEQISLSARYTFTSADVGTRYITVAADDQDVVDESDDSNNGERIGSFRVVAAAALLPDLEVTGLTVNNSASPSQFTVGEEVTIRAVVRNTGEGSAGSSRLAYYITDGSRSRRIDTDNTRGLDKDEQVSLSARYTFTSADVGTRYITVAADDQDVVDESDDSNNGERIGSFRVVAAAALLPDLEVTGLTVNNSASPSQFTVGEEVTIRAVVRNTGEGSAGSSRLAYYITDGSRSRRIDTDNTRGLDKDEQVSLSARYTFTSADVGTRYITVAADDQDVVDESDDSNNGERIGSFRVVAAAALLPDLEVTGLTVNNSASPSQFTVGEEVTIRAVVRNTGEGSAGSSRLAYYITDGSRSRRIDTDNTRGLDKDEQVSLSARYTFTSADVGARYISVLADDQDVVDESDDSNNGERIGSFRVVAADDHGDSRSDATAMDVGVWKAGSIETGDDADYFSFSAESGRTYTIQTQLGTLSDTAITLYDSDGYNLGGNNDISNDNRASRLERTVRSSGIYYVRVRGDRRSTGTYHLSVSGAGDALPPPTTDDYGDSPSDAAVIALGALKAGSIETSGDMDYFFFKAQSGRSYTIQADVSTMLSDTIVTLFDSGGSSLGSIDDFSNADRISRLGWTAPSTGTYYIRVGAHDESNTGKYWLSLSERHEIVKDIAGTDTAKIQTIVSYENLDFGVRTLDIRIFDSEGIRKASTGYVTVALPDTAWVFHGQIQKWLSGSSSLSTPDYEKYYKNEELNALRNQLIAEYVKETTANLAVDFGVLVGSGVIGLVPIVGDFASIGINAVNFAHNYYSSMRELADSLDDVGKSDIKTEGVEFTRPYNNCFNQVTVQWFIPNNYPDAVLDLIPLDVQYPVPIIDKIGEDDWR